MKKRMLAAAVLVAALAVLCLAGCGSSASDENYREGLPAWADEAAVTAQAREVIDLVNARDFDEVAAQMCIRDRSLEDMEKGAGAPLAVVSCNASDFLREIVDLAGRESPAPDRTNL